MNLSNLPVLILAGGKGTRLQSVVNDRPKVMAEVNGKPFIDILINKYKEHDVYLSVNYKKDYIMDYYKDSVKYVIEDIPLGTGGAIKKAFQEIDTQYLIVLNGDTYTDIEPTNFSSMININAVHQDDCSRYGRIEETEDEIIFKEKGEHKPGYINSGVYIIHRDFMLGTPTSFSLERFIESFDNVSCTHHNSKFIDIGVPDDYKKAEDIIFGP